MKKIIFTVIITMLSVVLHAQIFNTGKTLKKGSFLLGLNPVYTDGLNMFVHGGYGINQGVDFGLKVGVGENNTYVGADFEWSIGNNIAFVTGGHFQGNDLGIDGAIIASFNVHKDADFFVGADSDLIFSDDNIDLAIWIPVGIELMFRSNMSIILEGDIAVTDAAYHIFGGGLGIYF